MLKWPNHMILGLGIIVGASIGPQISIPSQNDTGGPQSAVAQELRPLHYRTISLTKGTWAEQALAPPRNLALTKEGALVGRRVQDLKNVPLGVIDYVLVDDAKAVQYAVVALDGRSDTYLAIPMSALLISDKAIQADSPMAEIEMVPTYTLAGLQQR